ncbi:hypothetical protein I6A84_00970 [Frankia sp. CNm7]|uniref:Uncharacterized protein n=1 Tax=Frankia nepalensis TaxID=1836974 RepID=A0A937UL51_9ACTN|nr:hypothetical protein [Frankia nepalensis]MBL7496724.1 hypothetical protein [Frankia nepalensis]MBL7511046.1 hypothetical protein [Frankia nepalensis]MBL7516732.1 hypothetical protein [Frankia nepalensis]MBL7627464.1 hypothetical protein [Frankia nepalensis]
MVATHRVTSSSVPLGESDEGFEGGEAVFGGDGQVAAQATELPGAGEGTQAVRDLLAELDDVDVTFGALVVGWDATVEGEGR